MDNDSNISLDVLDNIEDIIDDNDTNDLNIKKDDDKMPVVPDNAKIFNKLMKKQRKDVPADKKLHYNDIRRICKYINKSIFDGDDCCIWNGYVTNVNNSNKGTYINFYFGGKKVALHRLLYINFVENLSPEEYLKFSCDNKGVCCNINHLKKFKYQKKIEQEKDDTIKEIEIIKDKPGKKKAVLVVNKKCKDKKKLYVDFEN